MDARNARGNKRNSRYQIAEPSFRNSKAGRTFADQAAPDNRTGNRRFPGASRYTPGLLRRQARCLTGLHQLPRDASMLYDIGRVDGSGRVTSNGIINALRWRRAASLT